MKTVRSIQALVGLSLWILWPNGSPVRAQRVNTDSVYQVLDRALQEAPVLVAQKENDINAARIRFQQSLTPTERYDRAVDLYREYRNFDNDSALCYLFQSLRLARESGNTVGQMVSRMRIGHQYVVSGYYNEALHYLSQVQPDRLNLEERATYYHYWSHLYRELETFSPDDSLKQDFGRLSKVFRDSVEAISQSPTAVALQRRCIGLCAEERYDEAMRTNRQWEQAVEPGTLGYSLMAYYRSEIYESRQQTDLQKYWLAISAINELACCDRNLTALWKLAEIIYAEGDLKRAMRYIDFSWESISQFSSHKRSWLMAPIISDIHNGYQTQLTSRNNQLRLLALIIGLLAIFLLGALFFAIREWRIAANVEKTLREANSQLDLVNKQLLDSNRLKDNYIREFMQMCSTYILKLDNYRSFISRKLRANQIKDLLALTDSDEAIKAERAQLMVHFDTIFLRLFPTFVNDFNSLLQPKARIVLKDGESLNTTLRIFALVRLGIDESAKIAEFLNYTPNSIYNYRSRIKASALGNRTDFEEHVRLIGVEEQPQQDA